MAKEDCVEMEGVIKSVAGSGFFIVDVDTSNVTCRPAGKLGKNNIKLVVGDRVKVEMSIYDSTRGRITWRFNKETN
jgi:translation initiation factor IF-1